MLRAVRFAGKLDFKIDKSVANSMRNHVELLRNVPPARLFDEFLKLFQAGFADPTFELLREYGLFRQLFPETDQEIEKDENFLQFVRTALVNTDRRVAAGKSITPMFLVGVFLWAPVRRLAEELRSREKMSVAQSLGVAAYEISGMQQSRISIPKRFTAPMREMLAMQPRFEIPRGRRALKLLEHRRFRAAYDFMLLRSQCGDFDPEIAKFWTDVQVQDAGQRAQSFDIGQKPAANKRRRPHRRRKPKGQTS